VATHAGPPRGQGVWPEPAFADFEG
jgi:hypothetical protein